MQNKKRNVNHSLPIKTLILKHFEGFNITIFLNGRVQRKWQAHSYKEAKAIALKQEQEIQAFYLSKMW